MKRVLRKSKPLILKLKIIATLAFWAWLLYTLFFIHPSSWQEIYFVPFFISIYMTLFFTLSIFFKKPAIFILIPLGFISILIIRIFLIKDIINPLLITGLVATMIYFFTSGSSDAILSPKSNSFNQSKSENKNNYADLPQANRPRSRKRN